MTRPIGAILFGIMADRYGRKLPLMLNVIFCGEWGVAHPSPWNRSH